MNIAIIDTRLLRLTILMAQASLLCVLLASLILLSSIWPNPIFSVFALAIYILGIASLYNRAPVLVLTTLPLQAMFLSQMISFVSIEFGSLMVETLRQGTATGGALRFLIVIGVFLMGVAIVVDGSPNEKPLRRRYAGARRAFVLASTAVLGIIYLNLVRIGASYGFPLFTNAERFAYWAQISDPLFRAFINYHVVISLFVGALVTTPETRKMGGILIATHLAFLLLFGMKQNALMLSGTTMLIPYLLMRCQQGQLPSLRKLAIMGGILAALSITAAVLSYRDDPVGPMARFQQRVALQGQLWHLADSAAIRETSAVGSADLGVEARDWFRLEFRPATEIGFDYGLYRVMQEFAEPQKLSYHLYAGVGFIFALFPAWLMGYGYMAMLGLAFAAGVSWGVMSQLLVLALRRTEFILLPVIGLVLSMQTAAHVDGMSYRILGLNVWLFLGLGWATIFAIQILETKKGRR
jgi:hypothetical protein